MLGIQTIFEKTYESEFDQEMKSETFKSVKHNLLENDLQQFTDLNPAISTNDINKSLLVNCLHLKSIAIQK